MNRRPIPILPTLAVVLFCFVLGVSQVTATDVNRFRFVVSWDADPDVIVTRDGIEKVLKSRGEALGGIVELTSFDDKQRTSSVEVSCKCTIDIARSIFFNIGFGLHHVVSKGNPFPVKLYKSLEDAEQILGDKQIVLPYLEDEETTDSFVILERDPIIKAEDIKDATSFQFAGNRYGISFELNTAGAAAMETWSGSNISNYIAVVLNGRAISVAYIRSVISDRGEISGHFNEAEAKRIAGSLGSGRLPRLDVLSEALISWETPSPKGG